MRTKSMYLKMILCSLLRRRSRMLIALLAVAIGSTIMSGMITIYYDIPRQLGKEFRSYGANFMILSENNAKITADQFATIKEILQTKKLVGMAPYRYETTKINQHPYILAGTDMDEAKKNSPFWYIEGEWADSQDSDEVMIGKEVARTLSLTVGDTFTVQGVLYGRDVVASKVTHTAEDYKKKDAFKDYYRSKLKVKGIITTGGAEESFIFLNLPKLKSLLADTQMRLDGIECSIEANAGELEKTAKEITQALPGIVGRPVRRVTQSQDIVLGKLQILVLLVDTVVLFLTVISVLTTMIAVVTERRKEIGLKKALGAPDRSIIAEFIGEGAEIGVIGGALGVAFGFLFAQQVSLSVFGRAIEFSWWIIPVTLIISVFVTVLASIWPVKQATKVDPALVLRGE